MLSRRIIPCLDVKDGRVVKGKKFKNLVDVDSPEVLGRFYSDEGADELVFYDITASHEDRDTAYEFVEKVAREISIPFCVGGGVKSTEDFKLILRKGADKVSVNSQAVKNPNLIKEASLKFGAQCVVLSIDAQKVSEGKYIVYINGGRTKTEIDAIEWAIEGVKLGAGEIVINSIDTDGMKQGYDLDLLKLLDKAVDVPVIASGGAGTMEHFKDGVKIGNASGILAASVFHYKEISIKNLKKYLKESGVEIRL